VPRAREGFDFNPVEPPQAYATLSMRQVGLKNANRMKTLAKNFDDICASIKKRKMFENNADPSRINKAQAWRIPYKIIAFCEAQIAEYAKNPEKIERYELLEWDYFKSIVFEIYDHRVKFAPELNGAVNSNYVPMNEHVILYFVDKYRVRRKAEVGLLDLLINTRYYYEFWQRAKTFADNLQLIHYATDEGKAALIREAMKEAGESTLDEYGDDHFFAQPHAHLKDEEPTDSDVYTQEYFLHAYSLLCADRTHFNESTEGATFVRARHHDSVAKKIIPMIRGPCGDLQKWSLKTRQQVIKIKNRDGGTVEYLELDVLLAGMVEKFKDQRKVNRAELAKEFQRLLDGTLANVDLDQFQEVYTEAMAKSDEGGANPAGPLMQYPTDISCVRAFVFACLAGPENTDYISDTHYLAGCSRYALDSPVPSVATRCALYGNTREIMLILQDAEREYGGREKLKVDSKLYTCFNMGLPEMKSFKKKRGTAVKKKAFMDERSDEEEGRQKEQEAAAKLRRPLTNAYETPKQTFGHANAAYAGIVNLKLEFAEATVDQKARARNLEPGTAVAGGTKIKISSL
jgi:hypothetical protein